jgi:hypothetical protein
MLGYAVCVGGGCPAASGDAVSSGASAIAAQGGQSGSATAFSVCLDLEARHTRWSGHPVRLIIDPGSQTTGLALVAATTEGQATVASREPASSAQQGEGQVVWARESSTSVVSWQEWKSGSISSASGGIVVPTATSRKGECAFFPSPGMGRKRRRYG